MLRRLLLFFMFFTTLSTSAGEFENITSRYDKVFLYLYTSDCSYCIKFNPIYEKLAKKYEKSYQFIKIDANTAKGRELMIATGGYYVPNVVILSSRKKSMGKINPKCMLDFACIDDAVNRFIN